MSSSNLFSRLTISPAHWLLFLFSNDAKLGMVISGKDVDDINLKSLYIAEYQIIKYHSKINLSGKVVIRGMSGYITDYLNMLSISLANFWLLSLGKSETGSLYFDL